MGASCRLVISPRSAAAAAQLESLPESADPAAMDTQGGDSEFQPSGWPSESESEGPGHDPDVLLREADELGAEPSAGLRGLNEPDRDGRQASVWKLHLLCCSESVQGALKTQRSLRQMVSRQAPGSRRLFIMLHCDQACKGEGA